MKDAAEEESAGSLVRVDTVGDAERWADLVGAAERLHEHAAAFLRRLNALPVPARSAVFVDAAHPRYTIGAQVAADAAHLQSIGRGLSSLLQLPTSDAKSSPSSGPPLLVHESTTSPNGGESTIVQFDEPESLVDHAANTEPPPSPEAIASAASQIGAIYQMVVSTHASTTRELLVRHLQAAAAQNHGWVASAIFDVSTYEDYFLIRPFGGGAGRPVFVVPQGGRELNLNTNDLGTFFDWSADVIPGRIPHVEVVAAAAWLKNADDEQPSPANVSFKGTLRRRRPDLE